MAVCLDHQVVYRDKTEIRVSIKFQLLTTILLFIALTVKVWIHVETTDKGYELARERNATVQYDMKRRELELELSVLKRRDRLTELVYQKLGLKEATKSQMLEVLY